ncbi:hypothetical protein [Duganella sp. BuS-21]|uniref:hypothetical protein n=1 Tax=Duganella sp. BuS-21 TaxID=2943848 RepID=UPI0035A5C80B
MNSTESTKYRKTLEEGGVAPAQAQVHADALGEVLEHLTEQLATKEWVRAEIKMQLKEFKVEMLMWMFTFFVAQTTITIGTVIAIIRYMPR